MIELRGQLRTAADSLLVRVLSPLVVPSLYMVGTWRQTKDNLVDDIQRV